MNKREYAQANKAWIEAKALEEGVKTLPRGIYYKVLSEGRKASIATQQSYRTLYGVDYR